MPVFDEFKPGVSHEGEADRQRLPDMAVLYGILVRNYADSFRKILAAIMQHDFSEGAVLWHCTEGKDRCGLVSALVLLALDLILLFEGCFMGGSSILILMTPFIMDLSLKMGFNLVHLGVVLVLTTMIGGTTPPMAPALFTTCKSCNIEFDKALPPALKLLAPLGVLLLLLTYIPALTTTIPTLLGLM